MGVLGSTMALFPPEGGSLASSWRGWGRRGHQKGCIFSLEQLGEGRNKGNLRQVGLEEGEKDEESLLGCWAELQLGAHRLGALPLPHHSCMNAAL